MGKGVNGPEDCDVEGEFEFILDNSDNKSKINVSRFEVCGILFIA